MLLSGVCEGETAVVLNTAFEKCPYFIKPAYVTYSHQNNWPFSRFSRVSVNMWLCVSQRCCHSTSLKLQVQLSAHLPATSPTLPPTCQPVH